jgi:hypothetical protein
MPIYLLIVECENFHFPFPFECRCEVQASSFSNATDILDSLWHELEFPKRAYVITSPGTEFELISDYLR